MQHLAKFWRVLVSVHRDGVGDSGVEHLISVPAMVSGQLFSLGTARQSSIFLLIEASPGATRRSVTSQTSVTSGAAQSSVDMSDWVVWLMHS